MIVYLSISNSSEVILSVLILVLVTLYFIRRSRTVPDDQDFFSENEKERKQIIDELLDLLVGWPDEDLVQDPMYFLERQGWETYFSEMSSEKLRDELSTARKRSTPDTPPERAKPLEMTKRSSRYISSRVRREVWRRDEGRCVRCGSRENLEYDHIIPISKGGSNTARNIELLCEECNRAKSNNIE